MPVWETLPDPLRGRVASFVMNIAYPADKRGWNRGIADINCIDAERA